MGSEELQELHEHAEHARHDPTTAPVSLTMAILAVLVAAVSLLGHRSSTEEVVLVAKTSDQWAYFQAKSIRRHEDEMLVDLVAAMPAKEADATSKLREKYSAEADRYRDEQKDLEAEAKKLEDEAHATGRRTDRYDLAEVFLEIALVITSITLLSKKRAFWYGGIVLGIAGAAIAVTGLMMH